MPTRLAPKLTDPQMAMRRPAVLIAISAPLLILALEAALLTPLVEFFSGWMGYVASPKLFNAIILGLVLYILLSFPEISATLKPQLWHRRLFWLLASVLAFYTLLRYTVILEYFSPQAIHWYHAAGWLALVIVVSVATWLAFIPATVFLEWLKLSWHKAVGSALIAISFLIITPDIQSLWQHTSQPTIEIASRLMLFCGHEQLIMGRDHNDPMLGIRGQGIPLTVTRYCAEMESLAAFVLLAAVVTFAYWPRVRKLRMLVVLGGGITLLYLLNVVRVVLLVEIAGSWSNPKLAVALAHSRLASLFFLGLSLLILVASKRWWYRKEKSPIPNTIN